MESCIFCPNTDIINIHKYDNKRHNQTAKDYMIEFFGHQIEDLLRPDDAICSHCLKLMQMGAELKRMLQPLITKRLGTPQKQNNKLLSLKKKWEAFATTEFDNSIEEMSKHSECSLVEYVYSEPFNSKVEKEIAERNKVKSSLSLRQSEYDSEVDAAFSSESKRGGKRRKRRGNNWSRRKNGAFSRMSTKARQSQAKYHSDDESLENFYPVNKASTSTPFVAQEEQNSQEYVEVWLQNNGSIPAIPRQEEQITFFLHKGMFHECQEMGCTFSCQNIDLMTKHRLEKHKRLLAYACDMCSKQFCAKEDLEFHKKSHDKQCICVICRKLYGSESELIKHWQEHVKSSVSCKSCGKKYASQKTLNKHIQTEHCNNIVQVDYKTVTPVPLGTV